MATLVCLQDLRDVYDEIDIWVFVYSFQFGVLLPEGCPWIPPTEENIRKHILSRYRNHENIWLTIHPFEDGNVVSKQAVFLYGPKDDLVSTDQFLSLRRRIDTSRYIAGKDMSLAGASLGSVWLGTANCTALKNIDLAFADLDTVIYYPEIPF